MEFILFLTNKGEEGREGGRRTPRCRWDYGGSAFPSVFHPEGPGGCAGGPGASPLPRAAREGAPWTPGLHLLSGLPGNISQVAREDRESPESTGSPRVGPGAGL